MTKRYLERNIVSVIQQLNAEGIERVSSMEVASRLGESRTTIGRYLNALVDSGRLDRVGSGSGTRYVLVNIGDWLDRKSAAAGDFDDSGAMVSFQAYQAADAYVRRLSPLVGERGARRKGKRVGIVVVTPDRGAHGRYAARILGALSRKIHDLETEGLGVELTAIGQLAGDFVAGAGLPIKSSIEKIRSGSKLEGLIGALNSHAEGYVAGRLRAIYLVHAGFIESANSGIVVDRVLPLDPDSVAHDGADEALAPDIVRRYIEAVVLRSVCETITLQAVLAAGD